MEHSYDDASFQIPTASATFLLADDDDGADFLRDTTLGTPFPAHHAHPFYPPAPAALAEHPDLTLADLTPSRLRSGRARLPTPVKARKSRSPRKKTSAAPGTSSPLKQAVANLEVEDTFSSFKSPPPSKPKVFNSPIPKSNQPYALNLPSATPHQLLSPPTPQKFPLKSPSPNASRSPPQSMNVFQSPSPRTRRSPSKSPFKTRRFESPSKFRSAESSFQISLGKENVEMLMDEQSIGFLAADEVSSFAERSLGFGDNSLGVIGEASGIGDEGGMEPEDGRDMEIGNDEAVRYGAEEISQFEEEESLGDGAVREEKIEQSPAVEERDMDWWASGAGAVEGGQLTLSRLSPAIPSRQARTPTPEPADSTEDDGLAEGPMSPDTTMHIADSGLDLENFETDQGQLILDDLSPAKPEFIAAEEVTETRPVAMCASHEPLSAKPVIFAEDEVAGVNREPVASPEACATEEVDIEEESGLANVGSPPAEIPVILGAQSAASPAHSLSVFALTQASAGAEHVAPEGSCEDVTDPPPLDPPGRRPADAMDVDGPSTDTANLPTETEEAAVPKVVAPRAARARTVKGKLKQNTVIGGGIAKPRQKPIMARPQGPPHPPAIARRTASTAGLRKVVDPPSRSASRVPRSTSKVPAAPHASSSTDKGTIAAAATSRSKGGSGAASGSGAGILPASAQGKQNTIGPVGIDPPSLQVSTSAYQPQMSDAPEDIRAHEEGPIQDPGCLQDEIEIDVEINIPTHSRSMSDETLSNATCPSQDLAHVDSRELAPAPDVMDVDEEVADQQVYEVAPARAREPSPMRASAKRAKDESEGEEEQEGPQRKRGRTAEGGNGVPAPSVRPIAGRRAVRVAVASRAGPSASGSSGPVDGGVGAAKTQKRVQKRVASRTGHLSVSRTGDAAAHLASDAPPADAVQARSTRAHPAALARSDGGAQATTRGIHHLQAQTAPPPPVRATRPAEFRFASDMRIEARHASSSSSSSAALDASASTTSTLMTSVGSSTNGASTSRRRAPIPDFKAIHQAEEARLAALRSSLLAPPTHTAPLAFATEQRAAEREQFERARRAREEAALREAEARRRAQEEEEEREVRELRRRAVPKANEVPEWYAARKAQVAGGAEGAGSLNANA